MRALTSAELLDVWERGYRQTRPRRALLLLAAACPEWDDDVLAAMPIGRRDSLLLTLRVWLFGSELPILAACPICVAPLESILPAEELRLDSASEGNVHAININGWRVAFRSPTSSDLLALHANQDLPSARITLLSRCLIEARMANGAMANPAALPEDIVAAMVEEMAAADPQADVELSLACPACGHRWEALFDIVSFLWEEIHVWAQRALRDVHSLARAYGWREADILALSPTRRKIYLQLCQP
jgi:hypothetical protein